MTSSGKSDKTSTVGGMEGGESSSVLINYGRVLLIHFACRAPLPMGCFLRVTSSHLWAPGTLAHISDPTDAKAVSVKTVDIALPDNITDGEVDTEIHMQGGTVNPTGAYAYASSVEMVTSPDTYPIWRTRTPVVVILRHHHGIVQHHRYRYLVVCPGAEHFRLSGVNSSLWNTVTRKGGLSPPSRQASMIEDDSEMEGAEGMGVATSSEDHTMEGTSIGTEVMTWEDPFKARDSADVSHGYFIYRSCTNFILLRCSFSYAYKTMLCFKISNNIFNIFFYLYIYRHRIFQTHLFHPCVVQQFQGILPIYPTERWILIPCPVR